MKLGPRQQKWVDALRSGEYRQSTGALQSVCGHCCLGVLCEVAESDDVIVNRDEFDGFVSGSYLSAQPAVMNYVKIKTDNGLIKNDGEPTCLSDINDERKEDFDGIANVIEKNAEDLFYEPA